MKKSIFHILSVCLVVAVSVVSDVLGQGSELGSTFRVSSGIVSSSIEKSRRGRDYLSFKGIPYAAPPIGDLRFAPPVRPAPWNGVLNTTQFQSACAQFDLGSFSVIGQEDCLYLNVFRPILSDKSLLPVMVFFHSGAFMFASSTNYEPNYFMDENIILVTVNYRVGVLGFLNANVKDAQGNQGLKDQVLALKWVQENIQTFGGDRRRVTIFGDMAGGASTHYHMYSPMSRGLFSAAISQGGTALCTWAYIQNPEQAVHKLSNFLNCPEGNTTRLIRSLKRLNFTTLVKTIPMFFEWSVNPINPFGPSVEKCVACGDEKFLSETPYQSVQKRPVNDVPWMMGVNDELGLVAAASIVANPKQQEEINKDWRKIAPLIFYYRDTALDRDAVSDAIRQQFFQNRKIDLSTLKTFTDVYSDRLFVQGDRKAILSHLRQTDKPVWVYIMSKHSNNSFVRIVPNFNEDTGATEGDELQYLFNSPNFFYQQEINTNHKDFKFSENFVKLWASFATYGGAEWTWDNQRINWMPVDRASTLNGAPLQFLNINDQLSTVSEPFKSSLDFWDRLPLNEFENEIA